MDRTEVRKLANCLKELIEQKSDGFAEEHTSEMLARPMKSDDVVCNADVWPYMDGRN
jgi:hypothetical protein